MMYNVYCVRDIVSDDTICMFYATTHGVAVRDNLPALSRVRPVDDLRLYCLGTFDSVSMQLFCDNSPSLVSWDSYKFPEAKGTPAKNVDKKVDNAGK